MSKIACKCVVSEKSDSPCRNGECWHFVKTVMKKHSNCLNCNNTGFQLPEDQVDANRKKWHEENIAKPVFTKSQVESILDKALNAILFDIFGEAGEVKSSSDSLIFIITKIKSEL